MKIFADGIEQIPEVTKIDNEAVTGLLGVQDSMAYKIEEIEVHLHNREKWFGLAAVPSGETHRADRMGPSIAPFSLVSGNNDFGSWVQILGSSDTPVKAGMAFFDAHRFLVTTTNSTEPFLIQTVAGESATIAASLAAENFSEYPYIAATNQNDSGIAEIMTSRIPAGTKIWCRCICIGQATKTISGYFGIHEYIG